MIKHLILPITFRRLWILYWLLNGDLVYLGLEKMKKKIYFLFARPLSRGGGGVKGFLFTVLIYIVCRKFKFILDNFFFVGILFFKALLVFLRIILYASCKQIIYCMLQNYICIQLFVCTICRDSYRLNGT